MSVGEEQLTNLPREMRATLRAYVKEVASLWNSTLEAAILYGSAVQGRYHPGRSNLNLLLLLPAYDMELLRRYARMHRRWSKEGIIVPLFLTEKDLESSRELFPIEYLEMREHHIVLFGRDPFPPLSDDIEGLAQQCLREIRRNVLRLRQRFVEAGGTAEAAEVLLPLSITALLPPLKWLGYASDQAGTKSVEDFLKMVGRNLGMEIGPLEEAWRLKIGLISPGNLEMPRLFDRYLRALGELEDRATEVHGERKL